MTTLQGNFGSHARRHLLSHSWLVGAFGVVVGLLLLLYVPRLEAVSRSILLFAGFHILGGIVLLGSLYAVGLRRLVHHVAGHRHARQGYDFGWGPEWMNGLALAALVALFVAVAIQLTAPVWWPMSFVVLLLAASFFVGNVIMRSFRSQNHVVLPMVGLLSGERDVVLDAGCGAGRTTIALSRVLGNGRVIAVDRFDAGYIDDGGRALLEQNLKKAGIRDRVTIEAGDLTALTLETGSVDSAISTNVFDHLGQKKEKGLREVFRVLKPGGRFLMAVWVPGWSMFAVGSVLSFLMTSRRSWRGMAARAGFEVIDEGVFNFSWFALLQKPAATEMRP